LKYFACGISIFIIDIVAPIIPNLSRIIWATLINKHD
jgi:hypothetical protein